MTERGAVARLWAGFALLGAGLVHLAVVREHLAVSLPHGAFFAVAGAVQVLWALGAMARGTVPLPRTAVAVQLGLVVLWAVSRTTGLPVPPGAGTAEAVGRADVLAVVLELVAVVAVVVAGARGTPRVEVRPARLLTGAAAGALLVAALTTPALAATDAGRHAHPHGAAAGHHH